MAERPPGLTLRPYRDPRDLEPMAAILERCRDEDRLETACTSMRLARHLAGLDQADPRADVCLAEVNGDLVAWAELDWRQESDGTWVFTISGWVDPAWRRRGLGSLLLQWLENRCRHHATRLRGTPSCQLQSWAAEPRGDRRALLIRAGFTPFSHLVEMVRPHLGELPPMMVPAGLELRPVEPGHLHAILRAENEAMRDHSGHSEYTDLDLERICSGPTFDPTLWRVAWDGDRVAGSVRSFVDAAENQEYGRQRGYTEHVAVRRPWRRRGLARALLTESLRALAERGLQEAALDVHTGNPHGALRLYEELGFQVVERFCWYRRPL